jgi:hypothetical protein
MQVGRVHPAVETFAEPVKPKVVVAPMIQPVLTAPISKARFIEPNFANLIINMRTPTEGVPRNQITVPISPNENVSDELIFEGAADPSSKFYIPRYRITQQNVSGQLRYQVALQQSGEEWTLTVHLQKFVAPAIAAAASGAAEMEHRIAVILKHNQLARGQVIGQEEVELKEVTVESGGIRAVLRGTTLAERDLAYQALTDPAYGAILILRNWVTIGVPVPQTDRFRQVDRVFDTVVDPNPFMFPPALHAYIFGVISSSPGQQFELIRHQIRWKERWHSYYQNPVRSYQFYFLPDAFKIARRPQSPHNPVMSVRFAAVAGSLDDMQVSLDYIALPFVDPDRLQAATEELKQNITDPLPPGVNVLDFEPLLNPPDKTQLLLDIPRAGASAGADDRKGAMVDLRSGIHDSLSLAMPQFQAVYDAMFGSSNILFSGRVVMNLGGDQEPIPFAARMDDLIGELFDYEESPDNQSGGLKVKLKNAVESPVRINNLNSVLRRGQTSTPGQLTALASASGGTLPVNLGPGEEVSFIIVPSTAMAGEGTLHADFDLSDVQVQPDKEAVWNAILDPSAPAVYQRTIRVKTFRQKFDPHDDPDNQIMSVVLDFDGGVSVELNAENLEHDVVLRLPISDYVLRKVDQGQYRYKIRVIRLSGETVDTAARTDSTGILFPNFK